MIDRAELEAVRIANMRERATVASQYDAARTAQITAVRTGDALSMTIITPPRTKKNHGRRVYSRKKKKAVHIPSPQYERYRNEIVGAVTPLHRKLGLPLPEREYNIRAVYYVDGYGKNADRPGLDQALFDALQEANVIPDDWWLRTTDGTRIVFDQKPPRVEFHITPIEAA